MDPLQTFLIRAGSRGLVGGAVDEADVPPDALADAWNVCLNAPDMATSRRRGTVRYSRTKTSQQGGDGVMGQGNFDHTDRILRLYWWRRRDGSRLLIVIVRTDVDDWAAAHAYAVGDWCKPTAASDYRYECTAQTGVSGAGEPAWPDPGVLGDDVADNLVTWTTRTGTLATLYYNDPDTDQAFAQATGGPFPVGNTFPDIAAMGDRLFIATGVADYKHNVAFDGTTLNTHIGLDAPTTEPTCADNGAGNVEAGDHSYVYTFYDSVTKAESLPSPLTAHTVAAGGKKVTISVCDALPTGADSYRVYRTRLEGTVYQLALETTTDLNAGGEDDNVADDNLGYDTPPDYGGAPFTCARVLAHKHRLLWMDKTDATGGAEPNLIFPSEAGHPLCVDPLRGLAVRRDDGDLLTALAVIGEQAFAFKREHLYMLVEDPDFLYRAEPVLSDGPVGTRAPGTVVQIQGWLYFMSERGMARTTGHQIEFLWEDLQPGALRRGPSATQVETDWTALESLGDPWAFGFRARFYSDAAMTVLVDTVTSWGDGTGWTVDGRAFPAGGVPNFDIGQETHIALDPAAAGATLTAGTTYYVDLDCVDESGTYRDVATLVYMPDTGSGYDFSATVNWDLADEFFGIDYWPRREYWVFMASNGASYLDTVLVYNYSTGTVTRHSVFASAACTSDAYTGVLDSADAVHPLIGDYDGVVWQMESQTEVERDLNEAPGGGLVNEGVLAGAGPWTLTDADGTWPIAGTDVTGVRGMQVVLESDGLYYTGIITANTADELTITNWLLNRAPPAGTYTYYLGGLPAEFTTPWLDLGDPDHAKQVKQVVLAMEARGWAVNVEVLASDNPDQRSTARRRLWRRLTLELTPSESPTIRVPVGLRGRYFAVRVSGVWPGAAWALRSMALKFLVTGGRR